MSWLAGIGVVASITGTVTPAENAARSESLNKAGPSVASSKPHNCNAQELLRLHGQDGRAQPFVMPSKRGINTSDELGPEAFLDPLGEDAMYIQHELLREILKHPTMDVEYLR